VIIQTIWMWQLIWYKKPASNYSIPIEKSIKHSWCCIFTKNSIHLFEMSHTGVFDFAFSLQETLFPLNLAHLISANVKWNKNKEFSKSQVVKSLRNYMKNREKEIQYQIWLYIYLQWEIIKALLNIFSSFSTTF